MINLALFDIDGILTDGKVYVVDGKEAKNIAYEDIDAIFRLKQAGIKIGFITGEPESEFTEYVRRKFEPVLHIVDAKDKLEILKNCAVENETVLLYVGDSLADCELLKLAEHSFCPADAPEEVRMATKHVTESKRGEGVIREVADWILNNLSVLQETEVSTIEEHINVIKELNNSNCYEIVKEVATMIANGLKNGGRLFVCGNGGSAADAQHFVAELDGKYPAEALTVNTSTLTAIGNDFEFENVFSRQIKAKCKEGDIFIAISASGKSVNINKAISAAKERYAFTIGLTGIKGFEDSPDYIFVVPSLSTPRIQEAHILILHILAELIEKEMSR